MASLVFMGCSIWDPALSRGPLGSAFLQQEDHPTIELQCQAPAVPDPETTAKKQLRERLSPARLPINAGAQKEGPLVSLPGETSLAEVLIQVNNTETMQTQMPAPRRVFFCFVFFVATKKMKLLSGNPDGVSFRIKSPKKRATDHRSVALIFP
jgi:hypothetical protein